MPKMARSNAGTAGAWTVDEQPREEAEMVRRGRHAAARKNDAQLAKSQPYNNAHPSIKPMQVNHIRTVSHGTASLGEVMRAVMAYYDSLPPMMGRAPMELTIVCLDEDDYTDVATMPHQFQFLPDDGSCAD